MLGDLGILCKASHEFIESKVEITCSLLLVPNLLHLHDTGVSTFAAPFSVLYYVMKYIPICNLYCSMFCYSNELSTMSGDPSGSILF